jgi:hypothetical protein
MGILLGFAPFVIFALVDRLAGSIPGLIAGAAVALLFLARDWMGHQKAPKVLEIGTVILFGGLALYTALGGPTGSVFGVKLLVDAGLFLIVTVSIAIRQPFTAQYAREQVARELWSHPLFIRTNYVITAVWALAFLVTIAADLVLIDMPSLPPSAGIVATILALAAAVGFTAWYPRRVRASAAG